MNFAHWWSQFAEFFSVNNIAFTVIGYPMSYVEFLGTIFNLWSVWLVAKNRIATWPVGLVGVALFLALFYQIRLYSDTFEQVFYLVTSVYGWWLWARRDAGEAASALPIRFSGKPALIGAALATALLSVGLGLLVGRLHLLLPQFFPAPADYPFLDALTTVMSFAATLLMAHRRAECWLYWIAVDVIGIGLYFAKDVRFIALLYVIFLALAFKGWRDWRKAAAESSAARPGVPAQD